MSVEAISWVFKQDIRPATRKLVLLALADYSGHDDGLAFPSVAALESKTSLDRKTIFAALSDLEASGYLEDTQKRTGSTGQIRVLKLKRPESGTVPFLPPKSPVPPLKESRSSAETVPKTEHVTVREPSEEPSGEPLKAKLPPEAVLWNEKSGPLSKVLSVSTSRMKHLVARRKDPFWVANLETAVIKASQTPFCLGDNDRGWRASFDWIAERADAVAKIMEGKYDRPDSVQTKLPLLSVGDLRTVLQSKIAMCSELKRRYASEAAMGTVWSDHGKQAEFNKLQQEIRKVNTQISRKVQ